MTKAESQDFLLQVYLRQKPYSELEQIFKVTRKELQVLVQDFEISGKETLEQLRRYRTLWNNKKKLLSDDFKPFERFYTWYVKQYEIQDHKCYYCGVKEKVVRDTMKNHFKHRKRLNRGKYFELERKGPTELYSPENCVLACYFCNNDKSDIFTEDQYRQYLQNRKGFLEGLTAGQ